MPSKFDYSADLRRFLINRAESFAASEGLEKHVYRSKGKIPTILFKEFVVNGSIHHGNFIALSYQAISQNAEWKMRLLKPHSRRNALHDHDASSAKELDSCCSSDALVMNILCFPAVYGSGPLGVLLGFECLPNPRFGFEPKLSLLGGKQDASELDVWFQAGRESPPLIVEAKLTEKDFTTKHKSVVERYHGFNEVFDVGLLPRDQDEYLHYQLLRNVLAAHHFKGRFCLFCDERRPDLQAAWLEVVAAIADPSLRSRCSMITWQQIAVAVPNALQMFLSRKYGIDVSQALKTQTIKAEKLKQVTALNEQQNRPLA